MMPAWSQVTLEQITTGLDEHPSAFVYIAGKAVAERQLWEIATKHPDVDFSTSKLQLLQPSITIRS